MLLAKNRGGLMEMFFEKVLLKEGAHEQQVILSKEGPNGAVFPRAGILFRKERKTAGIAPFSFSSFC